VLGRYKRKRKEKENRGKLVGITISGSRVVYAR